ncbi:E3 ubiquitin-protein ligase TRIM38-like isoform X2 [Corticium candelabrum]|uniref:E3 ubiquitin-protein ligase TRIM38-like isoform X2 n=1 Tax=Corticium candelabrum TaxID=121492 RepID=UPI002E27637E|nr:E3 ubiquitin-protein ligase TRIM38-like isoform X2 [Corticium candelabrum]
MDASDDLPLSLPVKSILDHFTCPVCFSFVKNTHITPCGHKFCEGCIKECINRRHKCPCCNGHVALEQLIRDHQHDELLEIISREKEAAEKKYFESLIESASANAFMESQSTGSRPVAKNKSFDLSPIETVLRKHLKETLVAYEEYLVKLQKECICSQEQCSIEERKKAHFLEEGKREQDRKSSEEEFQLQKEKIQQRFESCATMLAESYDRYLSEQLIAPSLIPVDVSMTLAGRDITFHIVKVTPTDSTVELRATLKSLLESRGEKVISIDEVEFVLISPFAKERGVNIQMWDDTMAEKFEGREDILLLVEGSRPILQHGMKPGSELCAVGQIVLESDLPKVCFATTFQKDVEQIVDYFMCKDCRLKWICKPCRDSCHKGHTTVMYIAGHVAKWACCYCPKNQKVLLVKKDQ